MAKGGGAMDNFESRGEQTLDFPMAIRPNQSLLVEELKSKFEGIDRRFDTLFERLNDNSNFNANPVPKPVTPNPDAQIICRQISEVLQQWTGRHTQNYFELNHISQLRNAFAEDQGWSDMYKFFTLCGGICTFQIIIFAYLRYFREYFCPVSSKTRLQFSVLGLIIQIGQI